MYYNNQGQYDPDEDFFDNGFDDYTTIQYSDPPERQSGRREKEEPSATDRTVPQGVSRSSRSSADSSRGSADSSRSSADVSRTSRSAGSSRGRTGSSRERLRQRRERERKERERKRRILIASIAGGSAAAVIVILLSVRFVISRNAGKKQDTLHETAAKQLRLPH